MRSSSSSPRKPHVLSEPPPRWLRHPLPPPTRQSLDPRSPDVPSPQRRCPLWMANRSSPPLATALTTLLPAQRMQALPRQPQVLSHRNHLIARIRQIRQTALTRQPHRAHRPRCRVSDFARPPTPVGCRQPDRRQTIGVRGQTAQRQAQIEGGGAPAGYQSQS